MSEGQPSQSASQALAVSESNVSDIPELEVSKSVIEILQVLLRSRGPDNVDIRMKSTKRLSSLTKGSWFYIRVTTNSKINMDLFKDQSFTPYLFELLERMEQLESESHLCIQNWVGGEICQQNLVMKENSLVVQHESKKQKPYGDSSLHLRVHQSQSHMMKESQLIYKFLHIIKIFRPKVSLQFSVKMGENVCRSNYRVSEWISVSPGLPEVVSKPGFYLHKSSYSTEENCIRACVTGPDTLSVRLGDCAERLDVTCLGVYIPVVTEAARPSVITLTMLGPGWFPVDVSEMSEPTLLADLNLSKLGLKIAASLSAGQSLVSASDFQAYQWKLCVQSTNKHVSSNTFVLQLFLHITPTASEWTMKKDFCFVQNHISDIVSKTGDKLSGMMRETTQKALQSWLQNMKTRTLVYKSIRSVSKAVRDIVSMSDRENFRQEVLGLMQVNSSMELEKTVQNKLMDMSRRRHAGVWNNCSQEQYDDEAVGTQNFTNNGDLAALSRSDMSSAMTDINESAAKSETDKPTNPMNTVTDRSQKSPIAGISQSCHDHNRPESKVNQSDVNVVSPFQQLADDLMDAMDNVCDTDQQGLQMHEEPCEFRKSEEKIMAELFNEADTDEINETSDLNQSKHKLDNDVNLRNDSRLKQRQILTPSLPRCEAVLDRPKISVLKKDSVLKRSFSFPKDREHLRDRSAKFCRALSGDRIVLQYLSYEKDDSNFHGEPSKLSQSTQMLSSGINLKTTGTFETRFTSVPQGKEEYDLDLSRSSIPSSFTFNKKPFSNTQRSLSQADNEDMQLNCNNDFEETFDVISKFVDNCVDREIIDDIDGHLSSCHIQSQVMDSYVDKNNNTGILMDKVDHVNSNIERNSAFKASEGVEGVLADSDDWFDEAVADIENWFS